ncbi:MAG TPA: cupredoxin domain-containing protein [Burkholderiaceae bacterium]|nr:cupredoxin domain-containing protein [Burkholderiaceae bacterium]
MMVAGRRIVLRGALAAAGAMLVRAGLAQVAGEPRVIKITAHRFAYEPNEIPLKAGEHVVVEINSLDFVHGMNIPDLGKRFDLVPGRITRLELQPEAPGVIDFVCDNFCGEGHEEMHGRFVVSA